MKKACVIGIDIYKNPAWNLYGCVGDAVGMSKLLEDIYSFQRKNIRVLTNNRATKREILSRLEWLISGSQAGDTLVFYYAGHGSRIRDRDGDELRDHMDECLVPHDHNWDDALTDDILLKYLRMVPSGCECIVILDCCNSGTGTRALRSSVRFLPPPADIQERSRNVVLETRSFGSIVHTENHILLSGCQDNQESKEIQINGKSRGIFTYCLEKVLTRMPRLTYEEAVRDVSKCISQHKVSNQNPQLECPVERKSYPVFGNNQSKSEQKLDSDDDFLMIIRNYFKQYPELKKAFTWLMTQDQRYIENIL